MKKNMSDASQHHSEYEHSRTPATQCEVCCAICYHRCNVHDYLVRQGLPCPGWEEPCSCCDAIPPTEPCPDGRFLRCGKCGGDGKKVHRIERVVRAPEPEKETMKLEEMLAGCTTTCSRCNKPTKPEKIPGGGELLACRVCSPELFTWPPQEDKKDA